MAEPTRVLVTGAQGFLGRWICTELARGGSEVVGTGRSDRRDRHYTADVTRAGEAVPAPLPAEVRGHPGDYRRADLTDPAAVRDLVADVRPEVVIHSAAALRDETPAALLSANVQATANLLEAVGRHEGMRAVVVSSGSVYGAATGLPLAESTACHPVDPYAVSKLAAEQLGRIIAAGRGVRLWTARVFNLVGPGLQERHLPAVLATQLAAIANGAAPPVLRLGDLGTTRDLVSVGDAAAGVATLARAEPPVADLSAAAAAEGRGIVNVASGRETAIRQVVEGLLAAVDRRRPLPELRTEQLPPRRADVPRSVADVGRLRALGHEPADDLAATLDALAAYYLEAVWA